MVFSKTCPICKMDFTSLVSYMSHIKDKHAKVNPEDFVKNTDELKWSFRNNV